jgi:hypothetical protein
MREVWRSRLHRLLPFAALTALSLFVIPSILTPGELLCTAVDGRHFLNRLHELSWLADRGVLWPRWAPNLSYGYGYPVFHYYGSLAFYPSLLLHKLGTSLLASFQAGFWLAFVLSGWTAHLWFRSIAGDERAALVGAVAYLYVPYHINAVIYRLNLPEPWALVFPPLALYGLHCVANRMDWRSIALTAVSVAALPLTSNLATVVFAPVLAAYALVLLFLSQDRSGLLWRLGLCTLLAVGIAAFFVVPALVDQDAVQIERGYTPGGVNVFHNFLPIGQIFRQPFVVDTSRANPLYDPISLSPVVLAVSVGALAAFWHGLDRPSRCHALWAVAMIVGCILMTTRTSKPLYQVFPFLQVLQFPWRFLAPAGLLVALLASTATRAALKRASGHAGWAVSVAIATLVALLGWPLLYPGLFCGLSPNPTLAEAVASQVGLVGSISTTAEYLPSTVEEIPATSPMYDDYLQGRPVVRWDQSGLPEGARTLSIEDSGLQSVWEVNTPVAFDAVYQAFMFPGWQATVDGQPVDIEVAHPHGLIQIRVPAGRHTIAVRFGSTPDRAMATVVSLITATISVVLALTGGQEIPPSPPRAMQAGTWFLVVGIGVSLLVLRLGVIDRFDLPPRIECFDGQVVQGIDHMVSVTYTAGQRLLGYDVLAYPTSGGDSLELDLYWATTTGAEFRALVRLVDDRGFAWTEWNRIVDFPGLIGPPAPWLWGPERYTSRRYHIEIPPGTPPGTYNLSVATIDPHSRANHYVVDGTPLTAERTEAVIGQINVRHSQTGLSGPPAQSTPIGEGLYLVQCTVSQDRALVGETVDIYPLWYSKSPPSVCTFKLALDDEAGQTALQQERAFSPRYPPTEWQRDSLVRDQVQVLIPANLPPGPYVWRALVDGYRVTLGKLVVHAPERHTDLPADTTPVGRVLDGFAELAAYRAGELVQGQPLQVTLYWRAQGQTETSYKAFVHLTDAQGAIVAQSDAIPAAWTRLTTGWLPPEVIEDAHALSLPTDLVPGTYRLVAGMYDPTTGRRATTPKGRDNIVIVETPIETP